MTDSVPGRNLTYSVANSLGAEIVRGIYSKDNPIPVEETLSVRYEASRSVVREAVKDHGDDDPLESDLAFHVAVLRASCNRFYAQLAGFSAAALRFSIRMANRYPSGRLASLADHKKVADAIIAGRSAAAGEAMRKLIQGVLELIGRREALQGARRRSANANR
jgi:DNA-binding FadR family transcriptional regulator